MNDVFLKLLIKVFLDCVFWLVFFGDLDLEVVKNFVMSWFKEEQKNSEKDEKEDVKEVKFFKMFDFKGFDEGIEIFGGCLIDLEFLVWCFKIG